MSEGSPARELIGLFFERIAGATLPANCLITVEVETEQSTGDLKTVERIRIDADGRQRQS